MKVPEVEIAEAAQVYFSDLGYDVYPEVQLETYGPRADLVCVMGPLVCVVECKQSFGLPVFEQVMGWRRRANLLYVATASSPGRFATRLLKDYGVGHLLYLGIGHIVLDMAACFLRRASTISWKGKLVPEMKKYRPGTSAGYHTPFQETRRRLLDVVNRDPGITMKDAVATIEHHYISDACARQALAKWIQIGKVRGVEVRLESRRLKLYPASGKGE
jgi:hypothetical protein